MAENTAAYERAQARCCVVGGGPAGMVVGFLLARAGVDVLVLEKHADFLRDFRGDTVHPSTLELMYELGILDDFLRRPHQELSEIGALVDDFAVTVADLSHLPTHCKFVALMPQWDFLNFFAEKAKAYPQFRLRMQADVNDLIFENGRVVGVRATTPTGALEVRADLTVGADGRHSIVRERAGMEVIDLGAPIDVLWMRMVRQPSDPNQTLGRFRAGALRKIGDTEAVPLLGHIAQFEPNADVRREAEWTLRQWAADDKAKERAARAEQAVRVLEEAKGTEDAG